MKFSNTRPAIIVFTLLMVAIMVEKVDAWGWRAPRVVRKWCRPVCTTLCRRACLLCTPVCRYGCNTVCSWVKRKRGTGKEPKLETNEPGSFFTKLPCRFETWDTNQDGAISLEEFAFAGHAQPDLKTKRVFKKIDKNDDGKISKKELHLAPLNREKC